MCVHVNRLIVYKISINLFKFRAEIARKYNLTCKMNMGDKDLSDAFIYKNLLPT